MIRYMNAIDKASEMRGWQVAMQTPLPAGQFTGGHGYPDPEMFKWCDRLNALSRLCTLQSCAGHRCTRELHCDGCKWDGTGEWQPENHVWNGQLWLWPDEKLARWCYDHLPSLALLKPHIEKVGLLWHVECREIIDIQFQGAGHGQLENSMANICAFFEQGNMECNLS